MNLLPHLPLSSAPRKLLTLAAWALTALTPISPALADPLQHQLDKSQSRCHFEVQGNLLNMSGKFNNYSGLVAFDPKNKSPLQLVLKADLSDVTVARTDSLGSLEALSPESLFEALPNPIVVFNSTSITPVSQNLYQVQGVVKRGGRQYNASFKANFAMQSIVKSMVAAKVSGPVLNFGPQLPFEIGDGSDQGLVDCQLTFVPQANLTKTARRN